MMRIQVSVGKSAIHGLGIFAVSPIKQGAVIWEYEPGLDHLFSEYAVTQSEKRIADFIRQRGYINPDNPQKWILPCDEAQWWNFPNREEPANTMLGGILDGEHLILAARNIEAGEELTIPPESDADFERKMKDR